MLLSKVVGGSLLLLISVLSVGAPSSEHDSTLGITIKNTSQMDLRLMGLNEACDSEIVTTNGYLLREGGEYTLKTNCPALVVGVTGRSCALWVSNEGIETQGTNATCHYDNEAKVFSVDFTAKSKAL